MPAEKTDAVKAETLKVKKPRASRSKLAPPVEFGGDYHTSQIYSQGFEFAFMSPQEGTYKQACTFVYCKDFLHDAVWAMVNKTSWSIYGYKYDFAKNLPLDLDNCTLAFRNTQYKGAKEADFHAQMESCQAFLNGIEKQMKFKRSRFFQVAHPQAPCWLIIGDKKWQHAAPLMGLYTLLIRVGFAHNPAETYQQTLEKAQAGSLTIGLGNGAGSNDCSYLKQSRKGVDLMLAYGTKIFHPKIEENYPPSLKTADLHNSFGPVSFTAQSCKKAMPFWFRDEIWKPAAVAVADQVMAASEAGE